MNRTDEQRQAEVDRINANQSANDNQRDAFVALGHTVLFTASISFMGDVRPAAEIEHLWLLFAAWFISVVGLFALTFSFQLANADNNRRVDQIHDDSADDRNIWLEVSNEIGLWTFPAAMTATMAFAGLNLWSVT
ncbi:hypothetical protein GRI55_05415 [Erythrobacter citreus]|uniref:FtsH-binding integral membrane protein n=1 Tax=Qipengyuania citrea TaxID=225971 RepID=A0A6I4U9B5_9SPHN|nr:hypothetical protein [Qipengyuania citrea]MDQ0566862.1 FtsH-binding integral membrane protein [Qipengyuania citrea]MXP35208.1 hypothetical protein [Qipengyuania citrea]